MRNADTFAVFNVTNTTRHDTFLSNVRLYHDRLNERYYVNDKTECWDHNIERKISFDRNDIKKNNKKKGNQYRKFRHIYHDIPTFTQILSFPRKFLFILSFHWTKAFLKECTRVEEDQQSPRLLFSLKMATSLERSRVQCRAHITHDRVHLNVHLRAPLTNPLVVLYRAFKSLDFAIRWFSSLTMLTIALESHEIPYDYYY